jgi:geranylgeranyl pyrophosphate synthase
VVMSLLATGRTEFPRLGADLARVQAALVPAVHGRPGLTEMVGHLMGGAPKLIRPTMALVASYLTSDPLSPACPRVLDAAVAVELIHVGSMCHDDVIDGADLRRRRPSVNARWGNRLAVLAGDYLLVSAAELAAGLGATEAGIIAGAARALCRGQMLETAELYAPGRTERSYLEAITGKTAALLECACRLGALEARGAPADVELLARFGQHFGIAFQVNDDILDLTGTAETLGKAVAKDLLEGVYTLPVLLARRRVPELRALLTAPVSADDAARAHALTLECGAVDEAAAVARRHLDVALTVLADLDAPASQIAALATLAEQMIPTSAAAAPNSAS